MTFYDYVGIMMKILILYIKPLCSKVLFFFPSDFKRNENIFKAPNAIVGPRLCDCHA